MTMNFYTFSVVVVHRASRRVVALQLFLGVVTLLVALLLNLIPCPLLFIFCCFSSSSGPFALRTLNCNYSVAFLILLHSMKWRRWHNPLNGATSGDWLDSPLNANPGRASSFDQQHSTSTRGRWTTDRAVCSIFAKVHSVITAAKRCWNLC